jgi:hypothetical protein
MEGSDSIGVYGEAKAEYTRQLCGFLVPALETYFLDLLASTKESEKDPKRILWSFQDSLKQFPDWNMDKVQRETAKISESAKCDYLEEILTAVFIAHTKVLSAIRLTSRQKKLQITIPKLEHFLHRTMSECARLLWSNAYLFNDNNSAIERQKNLRQVEQLLHEGVLQSIRGMLPVKSILKEYLAEDGEEAPQAEESAAAEVAEAAEDATTEVVEPVVKEEELKAPPPSPAAVAEPALPAVVVDVSGSDLQEKVKEEIKEEIKEEKKESKPPMIVVDTEPSVSFSEMDTVFHYNPQKNVISPREEKKEEEDSFVDGIEIDESAAPEALDEFETLEDDHISFAENEFETL